MPGAEPPIDREVARQAAHWLMRLHGGGASSAEQQACRQWRAASGEHERAWQRVQRVQEKLGLLPADLAMGTLNRERRTALKHLLILAMLVPTGYLGYRQLPWQGWSADYRTAVGERRQVQLADGSLVHLNTDSAIDVRFSPEQRLIVLLRGEILISSGADPEAPSRRPLRVRSDQGLMQALGTRFAVRQLDAETALAVFDGKVRASPGQAAPQIIGAGEQVRFTAAHISPVRPAQPQDITWTEGQLIADDLPLKDFLGELSRYRHGLLRCAPDAAALRISGGFQLDNTDAILTALPSTLPVQVSYRSRYWVNVSKR